MATAPARRILDASSTTPATDPTMRILSGQEAYRGGQDSRRGGAPRFGFVILMQSDRG